MSVCVYIGGYMWLHCVQTYRSLRHKVRLLFPETCWAAGGVKKKDNPYDLEIVANLNVGFLVLLYGVDLGIF